MDLSWWEGEDEEPIKLSVIQPKTSGAETLPHKLDKATRDGEADYWSGWGASPKKTEVKVLQPWLMLIMSA